MNSVLLLVGSGSEIKIAVDFDVEGRICEGSYLTADQQDASLLPLVWWGIGEGSYLTADRQDASLLPLVLAAMGFRFLFFIILY